MTRLSYEERYAQMLAEIRASPAVKLRDEHHDDHRDHAEQPDAMISELATRSGISLAPKFLEYAFTTNSLGCRWEIPRTNHTLRGEIHLLDVFNALSNDQTEVFIDTDDDEMEELFDELRIIDRTPYGGGGELTAIRRAAATSDPEMWFYDGSDEVFRLDIGYCEYLEALLLTKGTYGWQYLFSDLNSDNAYLGAGGWKVELMLDLFPDIFPEHDYSELQRRWEARR
ncbi:hypothetical protein ACWGJW_07365 [Streptomyces nigrescens]